MVNYWAVIVATLVAYVISTVWYSPGLFGNRWMKLSKFKKSDIKVGTSTMVIGFIAYFIMNLVIAYLVSFAGINTLAFGLFFGLFLWVGFVATTLITQVLYEGKSVELYLINSVHSLIWMAISAGLFAVWA